MRWCSAVVAMLVMACSSEAPELPEELKQELARNRLAVEALSGQIANLEGQVEHLSQLGPCIPSEAPSPSRVPPTSVRISVATDPMGATVAVDGRQVGVTPVEITAPAASFELTLELSGYQPDVRTVDGSQPSRIRVKLTPL